MVNTVVTFGDNRLSSILPLPVINETNDRSVVQRRIYLIFAVFISIVIVLPNIFEIYHEKNDFAYHLLFIFHTSSFFPISRFPLCISFRLACLLLFFISTAIFRSK